ncbi:MAG TPA: ATP-binding protein [Kofleriaceae bacterium]|nr:ATP-binding protein [Kofleriaceae bacterium]
MRTFRGATRAFVGLFVLAMVALVLGAFYAFFLGWRYKDAALFTHAEDLIAATDAKEAFERMTATSRGYLLAADAVSLRDRDRAARDLERALETLRDRAEGARDRDLLDDVEAAVRAHRESLDRLIAQRAHAGATEIADAWTRNVLPNARRARTALAELVEYKRGMHEEATVRARESGERAALLMLVVAAGVILVAGIGAILLGRSAGRVYDREALGRMRAEEAVRAADQARAFFSALLDELPVGIVAQGTDGRVLHVSPYANALLGFEAPGAIAAPLARGLDGDVVEQEVTTPAGRILATTAAPLRDAGDQVVAAFAAFTDVTDRRRGERERELFLGALGHDLRAPLQAISLSAGALVRRQGLDEPVRRTAARIESAADRMSRLIQQLLDFTRSQHGAIPIYAARCDLVELARDQIAGAELGAPGRAIRIGGERSVVGSWDPDRIAQVLQNLIGNALEYGAADAPVRVTVTSRGGDAIVEVANHGDPLPEDVRSRIFEPFRRGGRGKGLGLGLFIARAIIAAHGGTIDVASEDGETTFRVVLPRDRDDRARDQQQPPSGFQPPPASG